MWKHILSEIYYPNNIQDIQNFQNISYSPLDNNDKDLSVEVYVYYPQGDCRMYKDQTLTFSEKGTYKIVFLVRDSAGNYAKKTFKVVVA